MHIIERAREAGSMQNTRRHVLANLALEVAQAAHSGDVGEGDANDIYETYAKQALRVPRVNMRSQNMRVQASKLRQIIRLAEQEGDALLRRVTRLYNGLARAANVVSLYQAYVDAARLQLARPGKPLSDGQIMRVILKRKR